MAGCNRYPAYYDGISAKPTCSAVHLAWHQELPADIYSDEITYLLIHSTTALLCRHRFHLHPERLHLDAGHSEIERFFVSHGWLGACVLLAVVLVSLLVCVLGWCLLLLLFRYCCVGALPHILIGVVVSRVRIPVQIFAYASI